MRGKVLLLSGSRGIAAATAKAAAAQGARVFFGSRSEEACRALEAEIVEAGGEAGHAAGDLSETAAAEALAATCVERFGRIDALFHVAGVSARRQGDGPVHECGDEAWDLTMKINLRSAFTLCRAVLRRMLEQPRDEGAGLRGSILLMSSIQAVAHDPRHFETHAYATSKAALIGMSQAMAASYASRGIRVNAIAPAVTITPLTTRAQGDPEIRAYLKQRQPLSGGIMEVGGVVESSLYLLGDASRHVTGELLCVDGGWRVTR